MRPIGIEPDLLRRLTTSAVQQVWWGPSRRRRGRFGILILGLFFAMAAVGRPWVRDGGPVDLALGSVGWLVFLAGAAMRLWATLYVGGRKGKELITNGPYAFCRNPLYVGSFLIALSVGLFLNSAVAVVGALLASVAFLAWVIPIEEARLSARFGDKYRAYCAATPRLIPSVPRRNGSEGQITVELGPLMTEVSRSVGWLIIPILCDLVTFLRDQPWWPHLMPVP